MKFELESTVYDLDDTPIENIFIEDFMPVANGTYVKVYLLAYKYAKSKDSPKNYNNEILAQNLDIPLSDVLSAWDYWERENVIEKVHGEDGDYSVKFVNLKQLYLKTQYGKREVSPPTVDSFISEFDNENIRVMFNNIDYIIRRQTYPNEKQEILSWVNDFNMSTEVISTAFSYAYEKYKVNSIQYVKKIIISWYDKGISTMEEVEAEMEKSGEEYSRYSKVMKSLGLQHRNVNDADFKTINRWYDEYELEEGLIELALEKSVNAKYPSVGYINGIIESWIEKGIKSVEDVKVLDTKPVSERKTVAKKTKFHNFKGATDEYSERELEDIADRIRARRTGK